MVLLQEHEDSPNAMQIAHSETQIMLLCEVNIILSCERQ